jgi:hypothetical protein
VQRVSIPRGLDGRAPEARFRIVDLSISDSVPTFALRSPFRSCSEAEASEADRSVSTLADLFDYPSSFLHVPPGLSTLRFMLSARWRSAEEAPRHLPINPAVLVLTPIEEQDLPVVFGP